MLAYARRCELLPSFSYRLASFLSEKIFANAAEKYVLKMETIVFPCLRDLL